MFRSGKYHLKLNKLVENLKAIIEQIIKVKPAAAKGTYMKNITVSSTMGPGIKVDVSALPLIAN